MDLNTELEIIKKKKEGMSDNDICIEYNISKPLLFRIIDRNGREKIIPNKKYFVNDDYFKNIDNEEKSYWLGFLYADGYVNDKIGEKGIELVLSSIDKEHIELFSKCLGSNYPIKNKISKKYIKKDGSYCQSTNIRIYNTKIVDDLVKLGCFNSKSWIIEYPKIPNLIDAHFIRGYFDGDGSIRKRGPNQYEVNIAGNIKFIKELKKVLEKNLIFNSYILARKKDELMSLIISNRKDCLLFYNFIYKDMSSKCFLKRKKYIFDNINNIEISKNNKSYRLSDNNGNIYNIKNGLKKFCDTKNLNYTKMKGLLSKRIKTYDGWNIERLVESSNEILMKHLKYFESKKEEKILILVFIIEHQQGGNIWQDSIKKFEDLDIDWWVKPQGASHLGLAYQSILNTSDINEAEKTAEYIQSKFDFPILICLSKQLTSKHEPVGESEDECWWEIGRTFDRMVSKGTKGIYIM